MAEHVETDDNIHVLKPALAGLTNGIHTLLPDIAKDSFKTTLEILVEGGAQDVTAAHTVWRSFAKKMHRTLPENSLVAKDVATLVKLFDDTAVTAADKINSAGNTAAPKGTPNTEKSVLKAVRWAIYACFANSADGITFATTSALEESAVAAETPTEQAAREMAAALELQLKNQLNQAA